MKKKLQLPWTFQGSSDLKYFFFPFPNKGDLLNIQLNVILFSNLYLNFYINTLTYWKTSLVSTHICIESLENMVSFWESLSQVSLLTCLVPLSSIPFSDGRDDASSISNPAFLVFQESLSDCLSMLSLIASRR